MKRVFLVLCFCVLLLARAEAQAVQPELSFRFGVNLLIFPGFGVALEAREPRGGIGVRAKTINLLLINGYGFDVYAFMPISEQWDVYFGAGWQRLKPGFPNPVASEMTYGLLGVRLRNGFFVEVMPAVFASMGCNTPSVPFQPCVGDVRTFAVFGTLGFAWRL
jgi:hypothetical protein